MRSPPDAPAARLAASTCGSLARIGADGGTRTPNRPITSRVRYQLRHAGGHGTTSRDKSRDTGPAAHLTGYRLSCPTASGTAVAHTVTADGGGSFDDSAQPGDSEASRSEARLDRLGLQGHL